MFAIRAKVKFNAKTYPECINHPSEIQSKCQQKVYLIGHREPSFHSEKLNTDAAIYSWRRIWLTYVVDINHNSDNIINMHNSLISIRVVNWGGVLSLNWINFALSLHAGMRKEMMVVLSTLLHNTLVWLWFLTHPAYNLYRSTTERQLTKSTFLVCGMWCQCTTLFWRITTSKPWTIMKT